MPGRMRDPSPGARDRLLAERQVHAVGAEPTPVPDAAAGGGGAPAAAGPGRSGPYEEWTVKDLRERAAELAIPGRSTLSRAGLIEALRSR